MQIAVDGPAGSGKSTIAKLIAKRKNITYLDTGAMYRAVTLKVLDLGIAFDDEEAIKAMLKDIKIGFKGNNLLLNEVDVSEEIRQQRINDNVSAVAALGFVRKDMVRRQKEIASNQSIIMDGRDIGTKVLPSAEVKIYLTASIEERAERRYKEMKEKGIKVSFEEICESIAERDRLDMTRTESPLVKADDAVEIDTTGISINEVVDLVIKEMDKVGVC
ncbi:(d)CMP kinase [Fusibacter sp. JL216-2]|uniref:(d)CMP kinase n=1 Tax=Fusibacter sp. JL216-2 TaxID=3071453 RepID=UPI003D33B8EB